MIENLSARKEPIRMERVMITLPDSLLKTVDETARRLSENRSQFVRQALLERLEKLRQQEFEALLAEGYQVMLETGGSLPVGNVPRQVIKAVDFKAPSSGMMKKNRWSILDDLAPHDEVKFVIGDRNDYDWARARIEEHGLTQRHTVLFSTVFGKLEPRELAEWLLADRLRARLQLQLHKVIWGPDKRGV